MAIISTTEKTNLKLELDNGIVDGKQKILSKTFNKVKTSATDEEIHEAAMVIVDLQNKGLVKVKKVEETLLVSE